MCGITFFEKSAAFSSAKEGVIAIVISTEFQNRPSSKEAKRYNASLSAALDILDYLGGVEHGATLGELRRALNLNKSRVMRLCGTLCMKGYLTYDTELELYSLGPRLLTLGKVYERTVSGIAIIRPVLAEIEEHLGETISFHVRRGDKRFCLCAVESRSQVRYIMHEGSESRYPFGSIWKVFMAFGSRELREQIYAEAPFEPETPFSAVTRTSLERVVARTLEQGYCQTDSDHDVGSMGISFPVFNSDGTLTGVLCLSGISERMTDAAVQKAVPYLRGQAQRLGKMLDGLTIRT